MVCRMIILIFLGILFRVCEKSADGFMDRQVLLRPLTSDLLSAVTASPHGIRAASGCGALGDWEIGRLGWIFWLISSSLFD